MYRFLTAFSLVFVTACDQVKPLKMPTDNTKEGIGLFTGETGSLDLTELCSVNQEQKCKTSPPCSKPDNTTQCQPNYDE
jgi:hypothetical protein